MNWFALSIIGLFGSIIPSILLVGICYEMVRAIAHPVSPWFPRKESG